MRNPVAKHMKTFNKYQIHMNRREEKFLEELDKEIYLGKIEPIPEQLIEDIQWIREKAKKNSEVDNHSNMRYFDDCLNDVGCSSISVD